MFSELIVMKKILMITLLAAFAFGCDSENFNNHNPYIPNYSFTVQLDMALPAYSQLQFPSNAIVFNGAGAGVRGIIVFNTGSGYNAFDRACPNQALADCSTMGINGIYAHCPCDDMDYSLFTGQASGAQYPMKQYRVSKNGTVLTVYN